jgi:hypothetical protein
MDGRVLLNLSPGKSSRNVAELAEWSPGPALFPAGGAVESLEPVSLILPTFFNAELKRRSLRFVLAGLNQSQAIREIILVSSDGEPQDFTDLQAIAGHRSIRVIESDPHNRGKSRNAGAAAATSPNLLFLDDDMLLRNWRWTRGGCTPGFRCSSTTEHWSRSSACGGLKARPRARHFCMIPCRKARGISRCSFVSLAVSC